MATTSFIDLGDKAHLKGTPFPLADANGNAVTYVDEACNVQAHYVYNAFGGTVSPPSGDMAEDFAFRFSSKYLDDETGLYYYGFRYYDFVTGRWLNRDLIEERGGLLLYGFVENDGANIFDSFGLVQFVEVSLEGIEYTLREIKNLAQVSHAYAVFCFCNCQERDGVPTLSVSCGISFMHDISLSKKWEGMDENYVLPGGGYIGEYGIRESIMYTREQAYAHEQAHAKAVSKYVQDKMATYFDQTEKLSFNKPKQCENHAKKMAKHGQDKVEFLLAMIRKWHPDDPLLGDAPEGSPYRLKHNSPTIGVMPPRAVNE